MLPGLSQPIHVIGLDRAWLAGDDYDSGQLRLTEHQVSLLTTTENGEPQGLRLALMHQRLADIGDGAEARKHMAPIASTCCSTASSTSPPRTCSRGRITASWSGDGVPARGAAGHRYPTRAR